MKIIRRVVDLNEANIIVGFLRANDIDARALDGATHSLIPTSYGIRIAVADKDEYIIPPYLFETPKKKIKKISILSSKWNKNETFPVKIPWIRNLNQMDHEETYSR